jgi:hypothetical protein
MSKLNRELGAAELNAEFAYLDSNIENIKNDYDNCYPWSDMKVIVDNNGNKWLQIPKFYTKYEFDENGYVCARYVSRYNVNNDWHLNPVFLNSNGKELGFVEVACYQIGVDPLTNMPVSRSGIAVDKGRKISAMRSLVDNYDLDEKYDYSLYDIWAHIMIQDLFMVEYANSDIGEVIPGYSYTNYSKSMLTTGSTDALKYHTGVAAKIGANNKDYGMKYTELENIVGNGIVILDNIECNDSEIKVFVNGNEYVSKLTRNKDSNKVAKLSFDRDSKLIFPSVVSAEGTYNDVYRGANGKNQLAIIGFQDDNGYGLFSYGFMGLDSGHQYGTYRMMRKQK